MLNLARGTTALSVQKNTNGVLFIPRSDAAVEKVVTNLLGDVLARFTNIPTYVSWPLGHASVNIFVESATQLNTQYR